MSHNPARLEVQRRADDLVVRVHWIAAHRNRQISAASPGLRSRLLRAVTSISLNISEACGCTAPKKVATLLDVAIGSFNEVERMLRLCQRLEVLDQSIDPVIQETTEIRMMTYGLLKRVLRKPPSAPPPPPPLRPLTSDRSLDSDLDTQSSS